MAGSLVCILFFTLFNNASLVSVIPFLNTIFEVGVSADTQAVATQTEDTSETNATADAFSIKQKQKIIKEKAYQLFLGNQKIAGSEDRLKALKRICIFVIILIFFKNIFDYLQSYLMAHVEQSIIRDLRNDLYRHINDLSLSFFHRTKTGHIISRITNDVTLVNGGISASFVTLIKNPLMIVTALGIAVYLSWQLTLVALLVAPFSLVIIGWIGLKLRKQSAIPRKKWRMSRQSCRRPFPEFALLKHLPWKNLKFKSSCLRRSVTSKY